MLLVQDIFSQSYQVSLARYSMKMMIFCSIMCMKMGNQLNLSGNNQTPLARSILSNFIHPKQFDLYNKQLRPGFIFRYLPILLMILVNGGEGVSVGWSTKIPSYNPRDIVRNLKHLMRSEQLEEMKPWFRQFHVSSTCFFYNTVFIFKKI